VKFGSARGGKGGPRSEACCSGGTASEPPRLGEKGKACFKKKHYSSITKGEMCGQIINHGDGFGKGQNIGKAPTGPTTFASQDTSMGLSHRGKKKSHQKSKELKAGQTELKGKTIGFDLPRKN